MPYFRISEIRSTCAAREALENLSRLGRRNQAVFWHGEDPTDGALSPVGLFYGFNSSFRQRRVWKCFRMKSPSIVGA